MAKEKTAATAQEVAEVTTPETDVPAAQPETVKAAPPKFAVERLRKDSLALFGVTFSTFDGATRGLTGKYTVEEMRGIIDKWQNTRVVPATKKEGN